jgi:hypothetical protein
MITTDVPAWLRRSDQAVTWARTMLPPPRRRHRLRDNRSAGGRYGGCLVDISGRILLNSLKPGSSFRFVSVVTRVGPP